jgi:hypothetical protein
MMRISDPQGLLQHKSMSLSADPDHKVSVTEKSINFGYDSDKEKANKHLKIGQIYTVEFMEVYAWNSLVTLKEIPGIRFNTVHFIDAE